ncbi:MAG: cation:proton antiporter [Planctomycetes bacterium]|nr:cation:proton antiporter [Planctomycetota bacterium]
MNLDEILRDVVPLLVLALVLGAVMDRLKQSAIVGYLLAGTILGPGILKYVQNREVIEGVAQLGVALLMFSIGLEFSFRRLRSLGRIALGGGSLQIVVTGLVASGIALAAGLDGRSAVAVGLMVGPTSTAAVLRVLVERGQIDSIYGRNALGMNLFQDLAVVPLVLTMTALGSTGTVGQIAAQIGLQIGVLLGVVVGFLLVSKFVLPLVLRTRVVSANRELSILLAVVTCLGAAWIADSLKLSPTLGAFIAGMLLGESPFSTQIRADIGALSTLFVTLFFASIGLLVDIPWALAHWQIVLAGAAGALLIKSIIVWLIVRRFGFTHHDAVATGICMASISEFAVVLGQIGFKGGAVTPDLFNFIVSCALITIFCTPLLVVIAPRIGRFVEETLLRTKMVSMRYTQLVKRAEGMRDHVIVVGMGPAGRAVVDVLRASATALIVVELNPRTVAAARAEGIKAEVGDASTEAVLHAVKIDTARAVVVALPDHQASARVIQQVKALRPGLPIIARARYHVYTEELGRAGAHVVVDEEEEIGRALSEHVANAVRKSDGEQAPAGDGA